MSRKRKTTSSSAADVAQADDIDTLMADYKQDIKTASEERQHRRARTTTPYVSGIINAADTEGKLPYDIGRLVARLAVHDCDEETDWGKQCGRFLVNHRYGRLPSDKCVEYCTDELKTWLLHWTREVVPTVLLRHKLYNIDYTVSEIAATVSGDDGSENTSDDDDPGHTYLLENVDIYDIDKDGAIIENIDKIVHAVQQRGDNIREIRLQINIFYSPQTDPVKGIDKKASPVLHGATDNDARLIQLYWPQYNESSWDVGATDMNIIDTSEFYFH